MNEKPKKRRFRIIDDCGWTHTIETDQPDLLAADIVLLVPHVRSAADITEKESTMTPKEYLQQYRDAVRKVSAAQDHLDELRAMATRITPNYGAEGGGTHQTGDKLGEAVARIIEAESRVSDELELLEATEREVIRTINDVQDGTLSTLLYERYINGKTWEQIAVCMNYSYRQITRMHGAALIAVKYVLECPTQKML